MRVLHVFKTYFPDSFGGVEQVIRQICLGVEAQGMECRIFTLSRNARNKPVIHDGATAVYRAQVSIDVASTPMSWSAMQLFKRQCDWADMIHYHFPWPYGDLLHTLVRPGKPALVTYHSDIVRQRTLLKLYQPLMHRFLGQMRAIVATSPNYLGTSDVLAKYQDKVSIIPIGVDEQSYPKPDERLMEHWRGKLGEGFFLFVGVIRYYKGLHILLDALKGTDLRVAIVGAGPIEKALREQANRLRLTNVHFLGALPEADKMALLHLCGCVVFPSHLRSEAFGVTLLEGAMLGKPMISSEIGTGSSFVNINGETGIVVPPGDVSSFREAMQILTASPALAEAMGSKAKERFDTLFTAKRMADAYAELYADLARQ
ncbi:Glycosyltransferase [Cupriavidus necator]|uniref:Glycosyltransferase n=1 Tax=Cupriavidus necator (strain ATCC 17699 / DSM 428 / KCTC 22496 / NCIMB 10442 / H16 / Stanier 337) TaxID=381666 RepID=A0AAE5ZF29_CUPNH|nr:glycosyltransferase family 4 protein [Cupriavidus necator]QCC01742.1 glycosyltransferase [Cupriavidus necator H16]QQB75427.1 glycosyltransferase family 4 protein [Cupriavidus necator]WKA40141.1 glycosyltransferase family 4 protein [Cupriavidus necator]